MVSLKTKIATVSGMVIALIMIAVATRNDVPQTVATTISVDQFDDIWRDAAVPAALKSASLDTRPKLVKTERIIPDEVLIPVQMVEKPKMVIHREYNDTCKRHKMRKVHHGRSWRCKR